MPNKAQPSTGSKLVPRSVRFTEELWNRIDQIAARKEYKNNAAEVIRVAIRQFIDHQEDIIGSKAHFQRTLRESLDEFKAQQNEQIAQLTEALTNEIRDLHKVISLMHTSSDASDVSTSASLTDAQLTSITLELHTILHLLVFAFSILLPHIDPKYEKLVDQTYLLNQQIMAAHRDRNIYDVTLNTVPGLLHSTPFTEQQFLATLKQK